MLKKSLLLTTKELLELIKPTHYNSLKKYYNQGKLKGLVEKQIIHTNTFLWKIKNLDKLIDKLEKIKKENKVNLGRKK